MHTRRQTQQQQQLSSLSIVLPRPPLPRRTSSIRSSTSLHSSPHTPRNSLGLPPPSLFKLEAAPRRSTDSWNSSIHEGADDDMEWEWTPGQLALLVKTLDALPSHLLSPFNGPIPPANVLDKISRSIKIAKDPVEWPHSVRSTRVMLFKLARGRAEESKKSREPSTPLPQDILQPTTYVPKKPLYRQSSMDFINGTVLKSMESIDCLSARLQNVDRMFPNPALAYTDSPARYSTPPPTASRRNLTGNTPNTPQTPAEDRMCTSPAFPLRRSNRLRRTTTTATGLPTIQAGVPTDYMGSNALNLANVPRMKRSDSFSSPGMKGLGHSLKRAPSYGSISGRSVDSPMCVDQKENSPLVFPAEERLDIYPSSDEEEKKRKNNIKKLKTTVKSPANTARTRTSSSTTIKPKKANSPKDQVHARKKPAKKITRTSSIFGAELPNPQPDLGIAMGNVPSGLAHDASPSASVEDDEVQPITPHRRLRRVKTANFPPRLPRRISFGHLSAPVEEESEHHSSSGIGLGSAFQLQ